MIFKSCNPPCIGHDFSIYLYGIPYKMNVSVLTNCSADFCNLIIVLWLIPSRFSNSNSHFHPNASNYFKNMTKKILPVLCQLLNIVQSHKYISFTVFLVLNIPVSPVPNVRLINHYMLLGNIIFFKLLILD